MDELRNRRDQHLTDQDGILRHSKLKVHEYLTAVEESEGIPSFPEFWTSAKWVNASRPLTSDDVSGRLLVLDFWTFCCINCMHIMPVRVALCPRGPPSIASSEHGGLCSCLNSDEIDEICDKFLQIVYSDRFISVCWAEGLLSCMMCER